MFDDPQVKHLGLAAPVHSPTHGDMFVVGQAVNMSRAPRDIRTATPGLGEHTGDILADLGYDAGDIAKFQDDSVV
jgi:crotonobetainyl-CoA:carnitine CoA-transferase CaiB-like acyl-CoA transferase